MYLHFPSCSFANLIQQMSQNAALLLYRLESRYIVLDITVNIY